MKASDGSHRLRAYLAADPKVRERFDLRQARVILADCDAEWRVANEIADDPIHRRVEFERWLTGNEEPTRVAGVNWTPEWQRRSDAAKAAKRAGHDKQPYDRDADPLLALDLRETWELLTGEAPNAAGRVHCPDPDHDDRWPDCSPRDRDWRCFACGANGSIIDLGALLYDLEPRGRGFFEIRNRLLAELGMEA